MLAEPKQAIVPIPPGRSPSFPQRKSRFDPFFNALDFLPARHVLFSTGFVSSHRQWRPEEWGRNRRSDVDLHDDRV